MAQRALDMLNVDKAGLDTLDRRYLSMLLERFDGRLAIRGVPRDRRATSSAPSTVMGTSIKFAERDTM
jgi:Holliday junction resolvasome RuvABC ATP-dependent DNA helicase subunit